MNIGGLFRSMVNPTSLFQLAMGPAGWASFAMRTIGSQIAMNAIQRLGQQLGLPQFAIDMVQATAANQMGMPGLARREMNQVIQGLTDQFNISPRDQIGLERAAEFDINEFVQQMERAVERGRSRGGARTRGGNSLLEVIANAMIAAMDNKADQMMGLARQMDNVKHKKGQTDSIQINTQLQVATQEFAMMMNATNNMIKTIGEGLTTMARKG